MALCGIGLNSYSQEFGGGLVGGFTTSHVMNDNFGGYHKFGIHAGAYVNRFITSEWAWQLSMRYLQKGAGSKDGDYKSYYNFMEIPLTIQYHFDTYFLEAGLGYAYLVNAAEKIGGNKNPLEGLPKSDILACAGAGYKFNETYWLYGGITNSVFYYDSKLHRTLMLSLYYNLK